MLALSSTTTLLALGSTLSFTSPLMAILLELDSSSISLRSHELSHKLGWSAGCRSPSVHRIVSILWCTDYILCLAFQEGEKFSHILLPSGRAELSAATGKVQTERSASAQVTQLRMQEGIGNSNYQRSA